MKKAIFYSLVLVAFLLFRQSGFAQIFNSTSLTDIYMGNYGFWDYQSTGSMQSLEQDSANNQRYSSVFLTADSSLTVPNKRVLYFFSSNGGNSWISAVVANIESSYPSLALQADGRAIVCFYDSLNSTIRLYRNQSAGSLIFDSLPSPPLNTGTDPKVLYYNNYIILFDVSNGGVIQKTRYSYANNSWESWQTIASSVNGAVYQAAKGYNGKVSVCWMGDSPSNNVKYSESNDTGAIFGSPNTVFTQLIAGNDTLHAFSHIDMVYYNNQPSITWDANAGVLPPGGRPGIRKFYVNPRIYFWNQASGLQLVADSSNYGSGSLPGRNFMISMGRNFTTLGAPSIGISTYFSTTYIYICYSGAKTSTPFGNFWYDSDIYTKYSLNGGGNWNYLYLAVPTDDANDDRFVSIVKRNFSTFGYSFALTVQKDKFPGSFRAGDTTSITRSYPEFYLISMFVHTAEENRDPYQFDLCPAYPNPFNGYTRIEYYIPRPAYILIDVYDIMGRKVETLVDGESNHGSSYTVFDGTKYASGVYFSRMFIDGKFFEADKLVLVK